MTPINGPQAQRAPTIEQGDSLSPREREVMDYIVLGMLNREIAQVMGVSIRTVENHVSNIMFKVGIGRRVLLALWWKEETK